MFAVAVEEIERAPSLELPDEERSRSHATLWVFDPKTGSDLSSYERASSGTVVVEEWGCDRGDRVRISVDAALLDSENHSAPEGLIKVEGEVEAVIGERPVLPD